VGERAEEPLHVAARVRRGEAPWREEGEARERIAPKIARRIALALAPLRSARPKSSCAKKGIAIA